MSCFVVLMFGVFCVCSLYVLSLLKTWSYGVMVSTLDFESSDPGSNPGRTSFAAVTLPSKRFPPYPSSHACYLHRAAPHTFASHSVFVLPSLLFPRPDHRIPYHTSPRQQHARHTHFTRRCPTTPGASSAAQPSVLAKAQPLQQNRKKRDKQNRPIWI